MYKHYCKVPFGLTKKSSQTGEKKNKGLKISSTMTGRLLLSVLSQMILPRRKWAIWGLSLASGDINTVKISFGGLTHRQRWNRICKVSLLHETRQMLKLLIVEFEASPTQQLLLKEGIETIEHEKVRRENSMHIFPFHFRACLHFTHFHMPFTLIEFFPVCLFLFFPHRDPWNVNTWSSSGFYASRIWTKIWASTLQIGLGMAQY